MPAIDGLRFFAFFFVLLQHYSRLGMIPTLDKTNLVVFVINRVQEFGWLGVDIFLTLSSFLIFTLLLAERDLTGTVSVKDFYIRRALRIWPLYFPYVLIAMVFLPWFFNEPYGTHEHLIPYLTFTGNFSYALFPAKLSLYFGHLWTISLEEQFYLVAPLLVFLGMNRKHKYAPVVVAIIGLGLTALYKGYVLKNAIPYPTMWVNPLCRLDPFILGALAAYVRRHYPQLFAKPLGLLWLLLALVGYAAIMRYSNITAASTNVIWQLLVSALCGFCLIMAALTQGTVSKTLSLKPLAYFGKISFGLYVYHTFILHRFLRDFWNKDFIPPDAVQWGLGLVAVSAITLVVGILSYELYERRFLKLKVRFENIHSRPA